MDNLNELPLGFGMALAQHPEAMERFANMSESEKEDVLSQLHSIKSKQEMKNYVTNLGR